MKESTRICLGIVDPVLQSALESYFVERGYIVQNVSVGSQDAEPIWPQYTAYDIAIVEHKEGVVDGIRLMLESRLRLPRAEVIILSDRQDSSWCMEAMSQGACQCLCHPIPDLTELESYIRMATNHSDTRNTGRLSYHRVLAGPMLSSITEEELYSRLNDLVRDCLPPMDTLIVALWDQYTREVSFPFCIKGQERIHPEKRVNHHGIVEHVIETKEPLALNGGDASFRQEHNLAPCMIDGNSQAELAVPILHEDGTVYGVLVVLTHDLQIRYSYSDLIILQAIANQTAATLQNNLKLREAEQLKDAIGCLAGEANVQDICEVIVKAAHDLIAPAFTGLILHDEDGTLRKIEPTIPKDFFQIFEPPRQDGGLTRLVVQSRQPAIIENTRLYPLVKNEVPDHGILSMLVMPLVYGERVLGVLYAHDRKQRCYSPHDVNLWSAFASRAAAALQTAQTNEQSIEDAKRLAREIASLTERLSLRNTMRRVADAAKSVFQADSCRLAYVDPPTGRLLEWEWASTTRKEYRFEGEPRSDGVTQWVLDQKTPLFRTDASKDEAPLGRPELLAEGMQSFASVPLMYRDRALGVLHLGFFQKPRIFGCRDKALYETFCTPAAMALDRSRRDEIREVWTLLYRGITACNSPQDIRELFCKRAMEANHADFALFHSCRAVAGNTGVNCIDVECANAGELKEAWQPERANTGLDEVYRRLKEDPDGFLIVNNLDESDSSLRSELARREGVKAYVALRTDSISNEKSEAHRIGIVILNYRSPTSFHRPDLNSLRIAGQQAAASSLRLQFDSIMQQHREQLLKSVSRLTETSSRTGKEKNILDEICESAVTLLNLDICSILEFTAEAGNFTDLQRGVAGIEGDLTQSTPLSIFKDWVHELKPIVIPDTSQDQHLADSTFTRNQRIRSAVICPLRVHDQPIGLFFADYLQLHEFTPDEIEEIKLFANLAAIFVHQSRLQQRLQSRTVLTWVSMLEDSWRHSLVQKASAIRNYAGILDKAIPKDLPSEMQHNKVRERIADIDRLAGEIARAPARVPQSWEADIQSIPLAVLLERIATVERTRLDLAQRENIQIVTNLHSLDGATVVCHTRWLIWAMETLLQNGYRAMMPDGGTVAILGQRSGSWAEIRVRDTGHGVPDSIRPLLFRELIPQQQDRDGMGLGALLVATMVQELGGSVTLEDAGPGTTTILIRLPIKG